MTKKYLFLAGLPRSGSTVLGNILLQNPRFHVSETSTLSMLVDSVKNQWDGLLTNKTISHELSRERERNVLRGIVDGYYANVEKPVVFDKNRAWPSLVETLDWMYDEPPKIIATVRDLRQVVESFEALYKKTVAVSMPSQFQGAGLTTMETRAQELVKPQGVIGNPYEVLRDATNRGWTDSILFVRYEDLGGNPASTIKRIYDFIEEEPFKHDFEHIKQVTYEDDRVHGFEELHDIETTLRPAKIRSALGQFGENFNGMNFWE